MTQRLDLSKIVHPRKMLDKLLAGELPNGILIAVGPTTRQPHTTCHRLVLRLLAGGEDNKGQWAIHIESWPDEQRHGIFWLPMPMLPGNYTSGDYFPWHRFAEAMQTFTTRLIKGNYAMSSIYRDEAGHPDPEEEDDAE